MAKGRTVSATELTDADKKGLELCRSVSVALAALIPNLERRDDFMRNYGRIHLSRDAGLGRAGAKLQRDALCTRGRTDKAPYSNRNLRWHPLVIAMETPDYAQEVEEIAVDGSSLVFVIEGELWYPSDVHKLPKVYCAPFHKWYDIKDELGQWSDDDWTKNSCIIPAMEYSKLEYCVEVLAVLGISVVSNFYGVNFGDALDSVLQVFKNEEYQLSTEFPAGNDQNSVVSCPLCLAPLSSPPANLDLQERQGVFQPPWRKSKREEGEAESLQLFHTEPLTEDRILHTPKLVRYGHRWCNVAMTDHSVDETLAFMEAIVKAHQIRTKSD